MSEELVILDQEQLAAIQEQIDQNAAEMRRHFVQEPTTNPVRRLAALLEGEFDYGPADKFFDFSRWNAHSKTGATMVDWAGLAGHDSILGGYCKVGQAYSSAKPQTQQADNWFDWSWNGTNGRDGNFAGMVNNGMWSAGYVFHQSAYYLNRGVTVDNIKRVWDGTIDEVCTKLMKENPDLYMAVRTMRPGVGREFDAARARDFADWNGDEIVWDVEYPYNVLNQPIGDGWMARSLRFTVDGAKFLMDNGCMPRHHQVIYTSEYVLRTFGHVELRDVVSHYDTICAGYYYDSAKVGYKHCRTVDELNALMGTFRKTWHPIHVGAADPGKIVLGYQVMDNLTMPFVPNELGGYSAIDVNVSRLSRAAFAARYPKFAKRRAARGETPDVPEDPELPTPVITSGTVASANGVRVRPKPSASGAVYGKDYYGVLPAGFGVDVEEIRTVGSETWVRVARGLWCCAKQGNSTLINLG